MEKGEREQLLDIIKTKSYYITIIISILLGIGTIILGSTITKVYGLVLTIAFLGCMYLIIELNPKIKVYEKHIIIGKDVIKYNNIKSIKFEKRWIVDYRGRRINKETFLDITFKNSDSTYELNANSYTLKKLKLLIEYIGKYAPYDVRIPLSFLEEDEIKRKKDVKTTIIIIMVFIIIAFLVIKFHFIPLAQRYN